VEISYLNTDIASLNNQSSQKEDSRAQSVDSSKVYSKHTAFH